MRSHAEMDMAHLKQRLVRAEMARADMASRLVSDHKQHASAIQVGA